MSNPFAGIEGEKFNLTAARIMTLTGEVSMLVGLFSEHPEFIWGFIPLVAGILTYANHYISKK